ncbi:DNA polymerase III subunit delta [Haliangium ochraceum]|uniref:DNA polymerase III subunit delta n=1 Tax=Haliangium ochraceum (strain DSM 14365 / JCM 11303 / SMP-2) TaxID=502025 RepID=D0LI41_HALO1|nr:DNA polymerase III subunit delta [Haliangium ochraceum]ACY14870.1 DNA polymerase III, delta subunit [Haliangium ochraceum DSM 14365]
MADSLLDRVTAGKLSPVYILHSEHPLLVDRAVAAIRDAAVPENARGFNYDVVEAKGASAQRILAAAQTLPMMAERRMLLVRDLAAMSSAELAKMVPYLGSPNPSTVLVGVTSKLDKRVKFYAAAKKAKALHELSAPRDLTGWLASEAKERGIKAEREACRRLVDVVGSDMSRLALALEQLSLFTDGRRIAADDVDELVADTRERSVFELTDALGAGSRADALAAVASLCEQRQSAIGVVVMVGRFMRQLALCRVASAQRLSKGEAAKLVGAPPFVIDKMKRQAQRYDDDGLARAALHIAAADRSLKGHDSTVKVLGRALGERVILDRLVSDLIALGER